ncbi:ABC-F family ATP-binding cassette domain-containing protein [Fodinicurvata sp. EGI_FJ10296]|uniref:ABC-F family ATP-binding cassette domain-containing protein n=1 Tax=Fodinicurvata sp. EGI_FJ10296 TaxID=3231908 RepID=UPI003455A9DC
MLKLDSITYRIEGRLLLDGASATIDPGHHVGLIGRNGTGKTTLFRMITGELAPDSGEISLPSRWSVGTIAQEAPDGDTTPLQAVLDSDRERAALLAEADTATDPMRIAEVHTRLADIQAYAAPARAASILAGLGFDESAQGQPCGSFSGGLRMRIALASLLFRQPDLLLLDEPTNHLDLDATIWLESFLKSYPGTILIISHDRSLLNRAVSGIIHLEGRKLTGYAGNYDKFEETRRLQRELQSAQAKKVERQRAHMQAFVDRFRAQANKARQAQSRLKALEKLPDVQVPVDDTPIHFDFPAPEPLASPIITLDKVTVGYDGKPVLKNLSLRIDMDDRIALLGANGNGKSTLTKLFGGRLDPMDGEIQKSRHLKVGYFAQHQLDEVDPALTPLENMRHFAPGATDQRLRNHLGRFAFGRDKAETKTAALSGGEKARLLLCRIAWEAPHILLLDEPTNHLDIDSRRALLDALNAFPGAVILVSHDPFLVDLAAERLWLVERGGCRPFDGDMDDYRKYLADARRTEAASIKATSLSGNGDATDATPEGATARPGAGSTPSGEDDAAARRSQRRDAAERRKAKAPIRKELKSVEARITGLQSECAKLEAALADPTLYQTRAESATELQKKLHDTNTALKSEEERWLSLQETLEAQ